MLEETVEAEKLKYDKLEKEKKEKAAKFKSASGISERILNMVDLSFSRSCLTSLDQEERADS